MKNIFYIDYPQEKIDLGVNVYRCAICKVESLKINGLLNKHKVYCKYRVDQENLLNDTR